MTYLLWMQTVMPTHQSNTRILIGALYITCVGVQFIICVWVQCITRVISSVVIPLNARSLPFSWHICVSY